MTQEEIEKLRQEDIDNRERQGKLFHRPFSSIMTKDQQKQLITTSQELTKRLHEQNKAIEQEYLKFAKLNWVSSLELPQLPNKHGLSNIALEHLCIKLKEKKYISSDTQNDVFVWVMGGSNKPYSIVEGYSSVPSYTPPYVLDAFIESLKIKWIKYNSRTNQYNPNKKAILDLLLQLKMPFFLRHDKQTIKAYFIDKENEPIIFNTQNFKEFDKTKNKSEYHDEIAKMIDSVKGL